MKKFIYWNSKRFLLPLCFMLAFGLMSCQEEEVIPLEEADHFEADSKEFSIETANSFIVNSEGEVIGYYDNDFGLRDKKGRLVKKSSEGANLSVSTGWMAPSGKPIIFLYKNHGYNAGQWNSDMRAFFTDNNSGVQINGSSLSGKLSKVEKRS